MQEPAQELGNAFLVENKVSLSFFFFFSLWDISCVFKDLGLIDVSHLLDPKSKGHTQKHVPYAHASWNYFRQSLLTSEWPEWPLVQWKGLVKVLLIFSHSSLFWLRILGTLWICSLWCVVVFFFVVIFNGISRLHHAVEKEEMCTLTPHSDVQGLLLVSLSLHCLLIPWASTRSWSGSAFLNAFKTRAIQFCLS